MKISVTREHIREGIQGNVCFCPIALAIGQALLSNNKDKKYPKLEVTPYQVFLHSRAKKKKIVKLPTKATKFVCCFDDGCTVAPITFELKL